MIQEEINSKIFCVVMKAGRMTTNEFVRAMRKAEQELENPKGKQTMKALVQQGQGVTSVTLNHPDMKAIENTLAKFGVDYAIHHDKANGEYQIFFKGKDADVISAALKQVMAEQVTKKEKAPSLAMKMKRIAEELAKVATKSKSKEHEHEKSQPER